jgi:uncharacterized damage-inducible protein DinB
MQEEAPTSVADLCAELAAARGRWEAALARVPRERLEEPGVTPGWSVRDLIAHVTWSQREWVTNLRNRKIEGSPLWELPLHERNAAVVAEGRTRLLATLLAESRTIYEQLQEQLARFTDDELADAGSFTWFPAEWIPQRFRILGGFSRHYHEHAGEIEAWLTRAELA